ncbi:stimulated by retinoic acid gene 8 protein homolog isoform X1 [Cynocephalus volans]|uniref:stimulated by retinoic acid gene 8 protein homolog isoform X1 n=1 Tax=Cynocephalus volans TaxID=110931 RepID=UPI002FC80CEB
MATPGEGSNPSGTVTPQPLAQPRELEPRLARRRLSQARHRATMSVLFNNLRKTIYPQSDFTASKWQVLSKAKNHIQELEQTLDNLLKMKESFNLEDGNANTLEEVRKEYASLYCRNDSLVLNSFPLNDSLPWCPTEAVGKDAEEGEDEEEEDQEEEEEEEQKEEEKNAEPSHSPVTLSPDLMEFERYLTFYKQTMDLLTGHGIISSQEVMLPIVSAAISHLWQTLSEEHKASLLQACAQKHLPGPAEGSVRDSGVDSQGASCSLVSTPEEILFEDAFDVASFLDNSEAPNTSSPSSMFASCNPENPEEKFQLYMQIIDFLKDLCCVNTQLKQEPDLPIDDEMIMLRCLETFDDEDL